MDKSLKKPAILGLLLATLCGSVFAQSDRQVINGSRTYVSNTYLAWQVPNEGVTGTTQFKLAKLTGAPATAIIAATSDTTGILGCAQNGAGTTGSAEIGRSGYQQCVFDGATVAGHYVQISSTVAGDVHDGGASCPASGQIIGRVQSTNGGAGTYWILTDSGACGSGSGSGLPALPTSPNSVPQVLTSTPSGGVGGPATWALSGISVRGVTGTGTTDTIAGSDCSNGVAYTNSASVTVTIPTTGTLGVPKCAFRIANYTTSTNTVTLSPTGGNISTKDGVTGAATLIVNNVLFGLVCVDSVNSANWVFEQSSGITYPLLAPNGTCGAPSYSFGVTPSTGVLYDANNGLLTFCQGANAVFGSGGGLFRVAQSVLFSPSSGSINGTGALLSTIATGVLTADKTTVGDALGTLVSSGNTVALTADWTCGTGGTVASCTSATIIGSGGGIPLTFTLPSAALSYTLECDGVVGQATAATANQWNLLTATNGATNVTANYSMATAATASAYGAVTDQASTTTTFQIAPSWTLGGAGTKMPFHIWAKVEGASASGTVLSLQLVAPTVGDLVTIYRGASCRIR